MHTVLNIKRLCVIIFDKEKKSPSHGTFTNFAPTFKFLINCCDNFRQATLLALLKSILNRILCLCILQLVLSNN